MRNRKRDSFSPLLIRPCRPTRDYLDDKQKSESQEHLVLSADLPNCCFSPSEKISDPLRAPAFWCRTVVLYMLKLKHHLCDGLINIHKAKCGEWGGRWRSIVFLSAGVLNGRDIGLPALITPLSKEQRCSFDFFLSFSISAKSQITALVSMQIWDAVQCVNCFPGLGDVYVVFWHSLWWYLIRNSLALWHEVLTETKTDYWFIVSSMMGLLACTSTPQGTRNKIPALKKAANRF